MPFPKSAVGRPRTPCLPATRSSFQRSQGSFVSTRAPCYVPVASFSLLTCYVGAVRIGPRGRPAEKEFSAIGERKIGADPAIRPILGLKALNDNLRSRRKRILGEA